MSITRRSLIAGAVAAPAVGAWWADAADPLDQYRVKGWQVMWRGDEARRWGDKITISGKVPLSYWEWSRAMDERREREIVEALFAHPDD